MKARTLNRNSLLSIGSVLRPHGLDGSVLIKVDKNIDVEIFDFIFIDIENMPVPFKVVKGSAKYKSSETLYIKLEPISDVDETKELVGCPILVDQNDLEEELELTEEILPNFTIKGVGKILKVDDYSGSFVATVDTESGEIMIPLADEMIIDIDHQNKLIELEIPEGLLDINE